MYDPIAGGFSTILDPQGNDWVGYRDDPAAGYPGGAASKFRGLPNLVYQGEDDGVGHPGFRKCKSKIVSRNQILTQSLSGAWEWRWSFYKKCAKLEVLKAPANRTYWFLYEGPVGGTYLPQTTFWASESTLPSYTIHDHYSGAIYRSHHQYFYFGEDANPFVFFMLQTDKDDVLDHYSLLGNDTSGAVASKNGMVVAGFGRAQGAKPLLRGKHTFLIGFIRRSGPSKSRVIKTRLAIEELAERYGFTAN